MLPIISYAVLLFGHLEDIAMHSNEPADVRPFSTWLMERYVAPWLAECFALFSPR